MSFAKSLATVSGLTIVSRIGGFIRDSLTAIYLGTGMEADAFFVAQRLPNLFRSLFAEGAFSAAFVPIYTTEQERNGPEAAQKFAGEALMLLLAALIPFSALAMYFMPHFMGALASGFEDNPPKYQLAVNFCTITFPYLALISMTALQTGVFECAWPLWAGCGGAYRPEYRSDHRSAVGAFFRLGGGLYAGMVADHSGAVQCGWLAISCWRAGVSIPCYARIWVRPVRVCFAVSARAHWAQVRAQINIAISTNFASTIPGAVSYLFYADRLNQLPLGIVGIAVATTLLPLLSRHIAAGAEDKVRHYTGRAIEFCLLLGLPAMIGLIFVSRPIIQILFQHGVFTHDDTVQTVKALRAYALGIPGFLLVKVFAAGFFARHDTKTPVKIAITALAVNIICAKLLLGPLQHVGIALAYSIAATINAALLYIQMRLQKFPVGDAKMARTGMENYRFRYNHGGGNGVIDLVCVEWRYCVHEHPTGIRLAVRADPAVDSVLCGGAACHGCHALARGACDIA